MLVGRRLIVIYHGNTPLLVRKHSRNPAAIPFHRVPEKPKSGEVFSWRSGTMSPCAAVPGISCQRRFLVQPRGILRRSNLRDCVVDGKLRGLVAANAAIPSQLAAPRDTWGWSDPCILFNRGQLQLGVPTAISVAGVGILGAVQSKRLGARRRQSCSVTKCFFARRSFENRT